LQASQKTTTTTNEEKNELFDLIVGNQRVGRAVTKYLDESSPLNGLLKIAPFSAVDGWFEEEEQIFVHPKDPYKVRRTSLRSKDVYPKNRLPSGTAFGLRAQHAMPLQGLSILKAFPSSC
jgi:hypothetical protein